MDNNSYINLEILENIVIRAPHQETRDKIMELYSLSGLEVYRENPKVFIGEKMCGKDTCIEAYSGRINDSLSREFSYKEFYEEKEYKIISFKEFCEIQKDNIPKNIYDKMMANSKNGK